MFRRRFAQLALLGCLTAVANGCCIRCTCSNDSYDYIRAIPGAFTLTCGLHCGEGGYDFENWEVATDEDCQTGAAKVSVLMPTPDPNFAD